MEINFLVYLFLMNKKKLLMEKKLLKDFMNLKNFKFKYCNHSLLKQNGKL